MIPRRTARGNALVNKGGIRHGREGYVILVMLGRGRKGYVILVMTGCGAATPRHDQNKR